MNLLSLHVRRTMPRACWFLTLTALLLEPACKDKTSRASPRAKAKQACERDHRTCDAYGLMLFFGRDGPVDKNAARVAFRQACKAGDGAGCYNFAKMVEVGIAGKQDGVRAAALMQKSCSRDYKDACEWLRGDSKTAVEMRNRTSARRAPKARRRAVPAIRITMSRPVQPAKHGDSYKGVPEHWLRYSIIKTTQLKVAEVKKLLSVILMKMLRSEWKARRRVQKALKERYWRGSSWKPPKDVRLVKVVRNSFYIAARVSADVGGSNPHTSVYDCRIRRNDFGEPTATCAFSKSIYR